MDINISQLVINDSYWLAQSKSFPELYRGIGKGPLAFICQGLKHQGHQGSQDSDGERSPMELRAAENHVIFFSLRGRWSLVHSPPKTQTQSWRKTEENIKVLTIYPDKKSPLKRLRQFQNHSEFSIKGDIFKNMHWYKTYRKYKGR